MGWTSPRTWIVELVTDDEMNEQLRDNMLALNPALSSSPPASPTDLQHWYYPADASGTVWKFRYNAGSSSPLKWECVGGAPILVHSGGGSFAQVNAGVWEDPGIVGPVTMARGGDYVVRAKIVATDNAGGTHDASLAITNSVAGNGDTATARSAAANGVSVTLVAAYKWAFIASGTDIGLAVQQSFGNIFTWSEASLEIMPVRVA